MIVSAGLGYVSVGPRRKRNFIAVQREVPDSSIAFTTPRQVPTFTTSKHIAKPFLYNTEFTPKTNIVPLKSLQEGSRDAPVFNAPVMLIPVPLRSPVPRPNAINVDDLLTEMEEVPFDIPFDYKAGIRPGIRQLKRGAVEEPDAPFPTRVGRPVAGKQTFGTYKLGSQDYTALGF